MKGFTVGRRLLAWWDFDFCGFLLCVFCLVLLSSVWFCLVLFV
jgi:hypothetical protein